MTEINPKTFDYSPYIQSLREKAMEHALRLSTIDSEGNTRHMTDEKIIEAAENIYQWLVKNVPQNNQP